MLAKLRTFSLLGIEAVPVEVEVVVGRPYASGEGRAVDGHVGGGKARPARDRRARQECREEPTCARGQRLPRPTGGD